MAHPKFHTYADKIREAVRRADRTATAAQIDAGVARVGKVFLHGLEVSIEKPKGSTRTGRSADGKTWARKMTAHYGYINKTTAEDGEHVDVFMGEHPESQLVFLMHQLTPDGDHDEIKVVMSTRNVTEAKQVYLSNYPDGWADERLGEVRGLTMEQFKVWLKKHCPYKKNATNGESKTNPKVAADSWLSAVLRVDPFMVG